MPATEVATPNVTAPFQFAPPRPAMPVPIRAKQPSLMSVHAVAGVIEGQPASWGNVLLGTAVRAALIAPGFYLVGPRDWKRIALGSAASSVAVTVALLATHAIRNSR